MAACQQGHRVRFATATAQVDELIEARDERKLLRFEKQIASYKLLIVDELRLLPLPSETESSFPSALGCTDDSSRLIGPDSSV
jgi:DNA replication protein DnaC